MLKLKKINVYRLRKGITIDKVIIFFFLLVNVGFYYAQFLLLIQLSYVILFAGFVNKILSKRKIIHRNYLVATCIFGLYAYLSLLWANDYELAAKNVVTLAKYIVVSYLFITMLDKSDNIKFALQMLAVSGLIYTIMYLTYWDFSALGYERGSSALAETDMDLPNINLVGLIASNSFVCLLFFYFHRKNRLTIILASIAIITIFFLGSRKSIIFCLLGILVIFLKLKGRSRFNLILLALVFFQILILFIPDQYFSFIWDRFSELKFFSTMSKLDYSDQLRVDFATYSIRYFNEAPLFGHGYFNFSSLFGHDKGVAMYSHNNFIETIVGLGIVGITLYYSLYFLIIKNIDWPRDLNFSYLIMILWVLNLFNHFFIVVSNDRFTWLLLPIMYAGAKLKPEKKRYELRSTINISTNPNIV